MLSDSDSLSENDHLVVKTAYYNPYWLFLLGANLRSRSNY